MKGSRLSAATWWLLAVLTIHQLNHGPYYAFLSIHLGRSGYSATQIGALWALATAAEIVTFRVAGPLQRHLNLPVMLTIALAITPLRWLLLSGPPLPLLIVTSQLLHSCTFALAPPRRDTTGPGAGGTRHSTTCAGALLGTDVRSRPGSRSGARGTAVLRTRRPRHVCRLRTSLQASCSSSGSRAVRRSGRAAERKSAPRPAGTAGPRGWEGGQLSTVDSRLAQEAPRYTARWSEAPASLGLGGRAATGS